VCHRFPFPPNRGGKIRPFQMIRHLAKSHDVTVASLAHSEQELREGDGLREHTTNILAEVEPSPRRWLRAVASLPSANSSAGQYFWSPTLRRRILAAATEKPFDAILVHCAFMADYVTDLDCRFRMLDYGDIDSEKFFEYSQTRSFPLTLGYGLEGRKLRAHEIRMSKAFDGCTVTTEGERITFHDFNPMRECTVIPNGVDASYFKSERREQPDSKVIAFLGRMDYYPNVQGIVWFCRDIFPKIRAKMPDAQLRIIGANPTKEVRELTSFSGVSVTGFVPDVRPHLTDAAVSVAPLTIARGTQNKILEAISMGIPVVSTPQAAKGIQATPGEHLLVGNDESEFADQVLLLLQNPDLRTRIADAARKQIEGSHNWARSMQILDEVLAKAGVVASAEAAPTHRSTSNHCL
jgi:sugar transferase (PEP-CTERM/EpsH1 system associated)